MRWLTCAVWRVAVASVLTLGPATCGDQSGLLRARISGNEASAIASLRIINSGQVVYSVDCAAGGYAIALEDLVKLKRGTGDTFIGADLDKNGVTKSGYRISLARDAAKGVTDVGTAGATCNGSTSTPASSYFASAEPVTPGTTGTRYFATDARAIVFVSASPIPNPIVESPAVKPLQ